MFQLHCHVSFHALKRWSDLEGGISGSADKRHGWQAHWVQQVFHRIRQTVALRAMTLEPKCIHRRWRKTSRPAPSCRWAERASAEMPCCACADEGGCLEAALSFILRHATPIDDDASGEMLLHLPSAPDLALSRISTCFINFSRRIIGTSRSGQFLSSCPPAVAFRRGRPAEVIRNRGGCQPASAPSVTNELAIPEGCRFSRLI